VGGGQKHLGRDQRPRAEHVLLARLHVLADQRAYLWMQVVVQLAVDDRADGPA
jgi:hypothetical protein